MHPICSRPSTGFGGHKKDLCKLNKIREAPCLPISAGAAYFLTSRCLAPKLVLGPNLLIDNQHNRSIQFVRRAGTYMGERELVDKDKLILRGLQFHGFHGVKTEEKRLGQKFVVDVDAWLDLSVAGETDDISKTVSYTEIYRIVKEVVEGPSQNLLESVAHVIANTTLLKFPQISAVRVKVGKPHVAVHGVIDHLGVEILRYQKT